MSDKLKIQFKRRKDCKQITEAFINGELVATITGNKKLGQRRVILSMANFDVAFVHDSENVHWTSYYEHAKCHVREEMANYLNKEVV